MLIERKEKKSKGLFYLIFTLTIIATLTISCKNKPTGTNEFAWEEEKVILPATENTGTPEDPKYEITEKNWSTLISGRTIVSKSKVEGAGGVAMFYFWAEFSDTGMKYGISHSDQEKPNYNSNIPLSKNFMNNNLATFSGDGVNNNQKGTVLFELDNKGEITNIKVIIESGTAGGNNSNPENSSTGFDGVPIDCHFWKYRE